MKSLIVRFVHEEEGQDLIEYALLATLITIAGIAGAGAVGSAITLKWTAISNALNP